MKISFVIPGFFKSGGIRIIFEYANRLCAKGHDVTVYVPTKNYYLYRDKLSPFNYLKYKYRELFKDNTNRDLNYFGKNRFKVTIVDRISNKYIEDGDIIIATSWPTVYDVKELTESKGVKVYFIQDYEVWESNEKAVDRTYSFPINKITISNFLHDYLLNKFNSESFVIKNGIDLAKYNLTSKIRSDKIRISFIVNELKKKNVLATINAINKIYTEYPNIVVKCFGLQKSSIVPLYAKYYENPTEDEIVKIYRETDIFVYSSIFEGFGLPPAEAMACKCAVVSNKVGAIPDYSKHLFSAYLCDPNNDKEIYSGIKYFIDNESEIARISNNGYNCVNSYFNWDESVNEMESYLNHINNS
jgi:hypothetical protein